MAIVRAGLGWSSGDSRRARRACAPDHQARIHPAAPPAVISTPSTRSLCGASTAMLATRIRISAPMVAPARATRCGYASTRWIFTEIATKTNPASEADALADAEKKFAHILTSAEICRALFKERPYAFAMIIRHPAAQVRFRLAIHQRAEIDRRGQVHIGFHIAIAGERTVRDARRNFLHFRHQVARFHHAVH